MIRKEFGMFLMAACVVLMEIHGSVQPTCPDIPSSVSVSVTGHRSPSGHWISQNIVGEGNRDNAGKMDVDVQYKQKTCTDEEFTAEVILTFSVNPEGASPTNATGRQSTRPVPLECRPRLTRAPPSGYMPLEGVAYFNIHATPLKWSLARDKCIEDGGFLTALDTPEKLAFVNKLNNPGQWAWLGMHERGVNSVYYTATDQIWQQGPFLVFHPGHPNLASGSDCLLILLNDSRLVDNACEQYNRKFVCEIPWF